MSPVTDPFALDDVAGGHEALAHAPDERLVARWRHGESPLCAAAELARRGDPRPAPALVGAAAFLDAEDVPVLATLGATDALAAVVLAPALPAPARAAAADALGTAPVTAAGYAALAEIAEGAKKPPWSNAVASLRTVSARSGDLLRLEVQQLRQVSRQIRDRVRGELRRQEFQRAVASGGMHPVVAALAGDETFMAGLLPPLADGARDVLLPYLLASLRAGDEAVRSRILAFFHRRWRESAAPALGCVARTPGRAREASVPPSAVRALAAMGAWEEVVAAMGAMGGAVRLASLGEIERAGARARSEVEPSLWDAALARARNDPDAAVRARASALSPEASPGR